MPNAPRLPLLTTARLRLEIGQAQHAARMRDYLERNREHLAPWEPLRPQGFDSLAGCQARLEQATLAFEQGRALRWVVLTPDRQRLIGVCNFDNLIRGPFQACHLGYALDQQCQGKGLMSEALQAALAYAFEQQGLNRVMANYLPENQRSAALLRRLGFEREGYARRYLKINGQWRDHILTAKLAPES
ncbi:ribosomal protein S5-alanine N-acetyltransferase [Ferrimonas marina]|uniref:[Ribosomal protein uS5]-alanine N-acetyltransferase n=1 Tax=Ferrimonas marina TaxID=299255 RepID=A0A1M5MY09_9GAMM|nr:ribosomal protein S5-alanine N-acetyltransferase [Ferrimonas marina]SHG82012.1 ribosomal-protein-alanine N-acetyltransferase [Ferrimonas marina]